MSMDAHEDMTEGFLIEAAEPAVGTMVRPDRRSDPKPMTPWNVVLLDDQSHSYEYVIVMMQKLFGHSLERAFVVAKTVDAEGRVVCLTTHKEHAELKRDQILEFGADPLIAGSKIGMRAVIEPAEFEGDGDDEIRGESDGSAERESSAPRGDG